MLAAASSSGLLPKKEVSPPPIETKAPILVPEHAFELVQLGQFRRDQFLVDKKTRRVWERSCTGKVSGPDCDGLNTWDEMYVSEITPEDSLAAKVFDRDFKRRLSATKK